LRLRHFSFSLNFCFFNIRKVFNFSSPLQQIWDLSFSKNFQISKHIIDIFWDSLNYRIIKVSFFLAYCNFVELSENKEWIMTVNEMSQVSLLIEMHRSVILISSSFSMVLKKFVNWCDLSCHLFMIVICLSVLENIFCIK
jgi:hypothetical protein